MLVRMLHRCSATVSLLAGLPIHKKASHNIIGGRGQQLVMQASLSLAGKYNRREGTTTSNASITKPSRYI